VTKGRGKDGRDLRSKEKEGRVENKYFQGGEGGVGESRQKEGWGELRK